MSKTEDKTDDVKSSFYEELEFMFDKFPKYHMRILLGDFNTKVGMEEIFKWTIGNESLPKISNDNEVRFVNFATSKNLPYHNIHKYTWTSQNGKTYNHIDHILINRQRHSNVFDF
jgi:endonuclease/exonuclease/phosphatase family metal-dependent hydrolase